MIAVPADSVQVIFVNRFFSPDESATSQLLTDLARGLVEHGAAVHIVCSRQLYDDASARLAPREDSFGVKIHRVATTRFGRKGLLGRSMDYASFYLSSAIALLLIAKQGSVIIAKTDPPLISLVAAAVAKLKRASLVNWQQDVFPEVASQLGANPLPAWLDSLLRRIRDASLRAARMNVVIGSRMLEYYEGRGIAKAKLSVIENWADAQAVTVKPTTSSALRSAFGFQDRFVVAYSGNLGRAHEFDTLLMAAEALREDRNFIFLMIGGGVKMDALRTVVTRRGLENFHFLPYQPRGSLGDTLAAADVHLASLLPSLEGLIVPSKFYGILAAGRPVIFIGDPDGDLARTIRAAGCGEVVRVGAGTDLQNALLKLRREPSTVAAMGARARELLVKRYSARLAIDRWIELLGLKPANPAAAAQPPAPSNR
jgi:colanic acid biosynthesis glycosyl transferase WcaI